MRCQSPSGDPSPSCFTRLRSAFVLDDLLKDVCTGNSLRSWRCCLPMRQRTGLFTISLPRHRDLLPFQGDRHGVFLGQRLSRLPCEVGGLLNCDSAVFARAPACHHRGAWSSKPFPSLWAPVSLATEPTEVWQPRCLLGNYYYRQLRTALFTNSAQIICAKPWGLRP